MRKYGGIEINEDFVDDLVDEWHENETDMPTSMSVFIRANTGWDMAEYENWVLTGEIPS